jgi:tetratricopeptide (TPR) repeat protein
VWAARGRRRQGHAGCGLPAGRYEDALAGLDAVLARQPEHTLALRGPRRGPAGHRPADAAGSARAYSRAVHLSRTEFWARKGLANALWLAGREAEAGRRYAWVVERLREAAPHEPHSNAVRGWCLYRLGRFTESVACYRRALDALDRPCGVQFDLGLTLLGLGRTEEARSGR